jgi:hypothetical protein
VWRFHAGESTATLWVTDDGASMWAWWVTELTKAASGRG